MSIFKKIGQLLAGPPSIPANQTNTMPPVPTRPAASAPIHWSEIGAYDESKAAHKSTAASAASHARSAAKKNGRHEFSSQHELHRNNSWWWADGDLKVYRSDTDGEEFDGCKYYTYEVTVESEGQKVLDHKNFMYEIGASSRRQTTGSECSVFVPGPWIDRLSEMA